MNDERREASALVAASLSALRSSGDALRAADTALAARPTHASNARWFMRAFVVRRAAASVSAVELFWTNLEISRDQLAACDATLSTVCRSHHTLEPVIQLQRELGTAGYESIRGALDENVEPGSEADASEQLRPTVARIRICENKMLAAIQGLASVS